MNIPSHRILALLALVAVAGCANPAATKDGIVSNDEYEYVTPLGSNIPVRVKKGQKPVTASPTDVVSGEQATNAIRSGGGQMTPLPGQKP